MTSLFFTAFLLLAAVVLVAAMFTVLSDPSRVDEEEKSRVHRRRWLFSRR